MIILSCEKVTKAFGIDVILEELSLSVTQGMCLGIIGANGTGKTTLFRLILGSMPYDSGNIYKTKDLSIGYLAQNDSVDSSHTIWDELLLVFTDLIEMEKRLRNLEQSIAEFHTTADNHYNKITEEYTALTDEFVQRDGYTYESQIRGVLSGLGFSPSEYHQPIWQLSGGQKTRVALAKLLLKKPELLLLDEPTNHLDLHASQWLESYLRGYPGTIMIISHDRYFLDHLCDSILEIENHKGIQFQGNYSAYYKKKQHMLEVLEKEYSLQQKEIDRQEAIIQRFKAFNREKSIKAAESRQKSLDKVQRIEKPINAEDIRLSFQVKKSSGYDVLKVDKLTMGFDNNLLFDNLTFALEKGDRVGIIGANGSGKTTLFHLLLGRLAPLSGNILFGTGVDTGYYDQEQTSLTSEHSIIDELWNSFPHLTQTRIRNTLALFLFKGDDVYKSIHLLSGGERGRVMLAKLMLAENNFLLLDEPTNHLDMRSKEVLEGALDEYPGTLFVISHDRYFLNKIVNKIMVLENCGITEYLGNYNDYLEKQKKQDDTSTLQDNKEKTKTAVKEERKKEREERQKKKELHQHLKDVEENIQQLETQCKQLEMDLCDPNLYDNIDKMRAIQQDYGKVKAAMEAAYEEWLILQD